MTIVFMKMDLPVHEDIWGGYSTTHSYVITHDGYGCYRASAKRLLNWNGYPPNKTKHLGDLHHSMMQSTPVVSTVRKGLPHDLR